METDDIPAVSRLLCDCYRWLADREEDMGPDELKVLIEIRGSEETVRRESQTDSYFVAVERGAIVGMVSVGRNEIMKLYVAPEHLRRGIAARLFRTAELVVIENGHTDMTLVSIGRTPVPFYEAMGMKVIGHRRGGSGRCAPVMRKRLEPGGAPTGTG